MSYFNPCEYMVKCCEKGDLNSVKLLIREASVSYRRHASLIAAVESRNIELVHFLLKNGAYANIDDGKCLKKAVCYGDLNLVKLLVQYEADIHAGYEQSLMIASQEGYLEIVKFLVENGSDIHARNGFALKLASRCGHFEIVKYLMEKGAKIHCYTNGALEEADRYGHLEIIKYLVEHDAIANIKSERGLRYVKLQNNIRDRKIRTLQRRWRVIRPQKIN